MPRVLIISESWSPVDETSPEVLLRLVQEIAEAGSEVDVMTNGEAEARSPEFPARIAALIRLPAEPPRDSGFLFGLRNALFFDTPANPANYALLRDRLYMHLQEVLYDAVIILCPPPVYLRLGYWIDETFGIPVWLHIKAAMAETGKGAFAPWNHRRLRKKYLAAAKLITARSEVLLESIPAAEHQLKLVAVLESGLRFTSPDGAFYKVRELLRRISRKQH